MGSDEYLSKKGRTAVLKCGIWKPQKSHVKKNTEKNEGKNIFKIEHSGIQIAFVY